LLASETSLNLAFPEIAELAGQCRFSDCRHQHEPGCAVLDAVETGAIPEERWTSYNKLQGEARHHALQSDATAQRARKQKWKAMHKANKRMYRERGR
jgi:ribosome biogenesis GTPase